MMKKEYAIIIGIIVLGAVLYTATLRGAPGNPVPSEFKDNLDQQGQAFESSPERGRYVHVANMAEYGKYDLTQEWAKIAYPDVGVSNDGRYYSYFAPGVPYLVLPFYLLGERFGLAQVFTFAASALASLISLVFIYLISRRIFGIPRYAALFASLIFGFGSSAWGYSVSLYQHAFTTCLIATAFYAVWRFKQKTRFSWLYASYVWAAYGLAILIDYPNVILFLPVMVYLAFSVFPFSIKNGSYMISVRWVAIVASVVFLGLTGLHFWHNAHYLGSWKQLSGGLPAYGISTSTPRAIDVAAVLPDDKGMVGSGSCPLITKYLRMGNDNDPAEVSKLQSFLRNVEGAASVTVSGFFDEATRDAVNAFQTKYLSDVMGPWGETQPTGYVYITTTKKINQIACVSAFGLTRAAASTATSTTLIEEKDVVGFFSESKMPNGFYVLLFSSERGLFFFAPIFILALLGIWVTVRKSGWLSSDQAVLVFLVIINVFLYSSWGDPWGGWAYGPRYLIPSMAWLAIFVGVFVSEGRYSLLKRICAFILFLYSSAIGLLGALTTNAIPPRSEALLLSIKKFNYLRNLDFIAEEKSGSFVYKTYLSADLNLLGYFLIIWGVVVMVAALLLFVYRPKKS